MRATENLNQGWVTTATSDIVALHAMVLARSLRKVKTTRKLVAVISDNVSHDMRVLLQCEYDAVLNIESDYIEPLNINEETMTKIYLWKIPFLTKCVFLGNNTLVVENCDELFNFQDISANLLQGNTGRYDFSFFVFTPAAKTYYRIVDFILDTPSINGNNIFNAFFQSENTKSLFQVLPLEYSVSNSFNSQMHPNGERATKLLRFSTADPHNMIDIIFKNIEDGDSLNNKNKEISKYWFELFCKDVYRRLPSEGNVTNVIGEYKATIEKRITSSVELPLVEKESSEFLSEAIAVVGMSGKFPGANNLDEFWRLLVDGKDSIRTVPEGRWETTDKSQLRTEAGFMTCPMDEFDGKFFGISPREISFMDPQQRILLEVAWEALEDSGTNPASLKGSSTGVFMGVWQQDYSKLLFVASNYKTEFQRSYLGNSFAATSARISFHLGLNGPNVATESGCSSSLVSIHLACESLRRGDCNLALAGGVNLLLYPFSRESLAAEHILAVDGHCKTFDEKANGFGRAEGCGVIVLKRYSEAIKQNDNILAIIRGSAVTQEGTTSSFGTPSKLCQELAIKEAIKYSRINPMDVSYVEAHGTGTKVGDPTEISAIAAAYGGNREKPLYIGSVKTNIGHAESAAGVAGLIKVILSLRNETIPPHRNLNTLNPSIDLDSIPAIIPMKPVGWQRSPTGSRLAGVSSFGISGTNVHIIIQESHNAQLPDKRTSYLHGITGDRTDHILTLSAKSEIALEELARRYLNFFRSNPSISLADVAFTANTGRAHFPLRMATVGKTLAEVQANLEHSLISKRNCTVSAGKRRKIAFLFTGQGSQYPRMAKTLYETHPVFREALDKCNSVLSNNFQISFLDVLWGDDQNKLNQTIYSQTAIFCVEYSLLQLWKSVGVEPDCVLGHSLGEFAAATAAGIISLEDAIKLVCVRSQLIHCLPGGGMLSVKGKCSHIEKLVDQFNIQAPSGQWLDVAVINSDDDVVVAGRPLALDSFANICKSEGMKFQYLAASQAFHSRELQNILEDYSKVTASIVYKNSQCSYISGMTGRVVHGSEMNANYWLQHSLKSVNFRDAMKTMFVDEGCQIFIEIGPHPVLLALGISNVPATSVQDILWLPSIRKNENEWSTFMQSLSKLYVSGFDVNWRALDAPYSRKKVSLPSYPFQRQKYWFETSNNIEHSIVQGNSLHPLLGQKLSLITDDCIFRNYINLRNLSYICEHKVAKKIIMPGAAFLEAIFVAGHVATQGNDEMLVEPFVPLLLENFYIESSLELTQEKVCEIQISVSQRDDNVGNGLRINLHSLEFDEIGNKNWRKHASGHFGVFAGKMDDLDLPAIRSRCKTKFNVEVLYEGVQNAGIDFGPAFRSIGTSFKNDTEFLGEIVQQDITDTMDYLTHPIIIDAMIQMYAFRFETDKDLYLPVGVEKFLWFGRSNSKALYMYSKINEGVNQISLVDASGKVLVFMQGVKLFKTTVSSFLQSFEIRGNKTVKLYKEVWRIRQRVGSSTLKIKNIPDIDVNTASFSKHLEYIMEHETRAHYYEIMNDKLSFLCILNAFYELGWKPKVGQIIETREFLSNLMIAFNFQEVVERFFEIFAEEGILRVNDNNNDEWEVVKAPPTADLALQVLDESVGSPGKFILTEDSGYSTLLYGMVGRKVSAILQGHESALTHLFPEDGESTSAESLYSDSLICKKGNSIVVKVIEQIAENILHTDSYSSNTPVRFLEIGAGTGGTTAFALPALKQSCVNFKYTFTDIASVLLMKAQVRFSEFEKNMEFKLLNIEEDPKSQGYSAFQYDVIIASNVLHATTNLSETVANLRHLMAPGGFLILFETLKPQRYLDCTFGLLEGYWRFKDYDIRPKHTLVNADTWTSLLEANNFSSTVNLTYEGGNYGVIVGRADSTLCNYKQVTKLESQMPVWIIITNSEKCEFTFLIQKHLRNLGRNVIGLNFEKHIINFTEYCSAIQEQSIKVEGIMFLSGLNVESMDLENVFQSLLNCAKMLETLSHKFRPRLFVVTNGLAYINDQKPTSPTPAMLCGFMKTMKSENPNLYVGIIDLDPAEEDLDHMCNDLCSELWSEEANFESRIAFREKKRYVDRLVLHEPLTKPMSLPRSERYTIALPSTRQVADLEFEIASKPVLAENEIEVAVKATSLNFRDFLVIIKPEGYYTKADVIGTDYSGVVTSVGSSVREFKAGDEVYGLTFAGALSSHTLAPWQTVARKPPALTFNEAAALPTVFLTAYYCLQNIAGLKCGETVLIHVASGGVGLCAIQIAQMIGAKIIATAGSSRKRTYLKSLGVQHVFHSRNTNYGKQIEEATGGNGVDVVLNSLTGPNFKETTLSICSKGARFVEMGKVAIWKPEEVMGLRPDVLYTVIDLEQVNESTMEQLCRKMSQLFMDGIMKPLPYVRFDATLCKDAIMYLQKTLHIGKIVLTLPEVTLTQRKLVITNRLFTDESTYLLTGGLGGIGFEIAKILPKWGAKTIVLANRKPPSEEAMKVIAKLNEEGARIIPKQVDIGDYDECKILFESFKELPPLRGVFHAAVVLADGVIGNQTWDKFEVAFHAKVHGAWNLHCLTKEMNLEYFIVFSSIASNTGSIGQCNYVSANCFLDSLVEHRHSLGLPAQAINWGSWAKVGVASKLSIGTEGSFGVRPIPPVIGLQTFKALLDLRYKHITPIDIDFISYRNAFPHCTRYIEEIPIEDDASVISTNNSNSGQNFWKQMEQLDTEGKLNSIKGYLEGFIRQILRLPPNEIINENESFTEMGMDSLMAVEMKNRLQIILGKRVVLHAACILDHPNGKSLSAYLTELVNSVCDGGDNGYSSGDFESNIIDTKYENDYKLFHSDLVLPDHIRAKVGIPSKRPSEFRNVLLTGATGRLGSYVLHEIAQQKHLRLFCLLRGKSEEEARQRLKDILTKNDLMNGVDISSITIVLGNLAKKNFGLSDQHYDKLASEIDAIFNFAIKANHLEPYMIYNSNDENSIRSVNTLGFLHLLEFACESRLKHVYHSSSFAAANVVKDGFIYEELPEEDNMGEGLTMGYAITKFVCEKLARQAIERGIPCTVYRFASVFGHSVTGQFSVDHNHLMNFLITCFKLGKYPEGLKGWYVIPVDIAALIAVSIMANENAQVGLYNVLNPCAMSPKHIKEFARLVHRPVELCSDTEFSETLLTKGKDSPLYVFKDFYSDNNWIFNLANATPAFELVTMHSDENCEDEGFIGKILQVLPDINKMIPSLPNTFKKYAEYALKNNII